MSKVDILVVGGGISGASFAFHAARAGRRVLLLEREARVGGSLCSERGPENFWFELGAHTAYNSYGAFLELLEGCGLLSELLAREKPVLRFLEGDELVRGQNLGLLLRLFRKGEFLRALPRWIGARQDGQSVRAYYSRLVGPRNYERVLAPLLSAVPSQPADDFPADMLFKKRARRTDVRRSFTLPGGLRSAVEALVRQPGIELMTGRAVAGLERTGGEFVATLAGSQHERVQAEVLALALAPGAATALLGGVAPELAEHVARIRETQVDSLGFAVRSERIRLPYATFVIPRHDVFHSIVTRDVVPDATRRGFTFHFRPGLTREERLRRALAVLHLSPGDLEAVTERSTKLPAPVLGHAELVAELDRRLAGRPLALTGNWFSGLSIEDCALRSRAEWRRIAAGA